MTHGKAGLAIILMGLSLPALAQTSTDKKTTPAAPAAASASSVPDGGEPVFIRPETAEQRKARIGSAEDPGSNPDPSKHFWRFGKSEHIERFERRFAAYDQEEGYVRPMAMVNIAKEIYQQNDKYVWVWIIDPESYPTVEAAAPPPKTRFNKETIKFLTSIRGDFTTLTPPDSETVIRFEQSSEGLPTSGSWRNALAIADMNGDGFVDIIAPPERAGSTAPAIFLGDGKGHWKYWSALKWPRPLDYGAVVAADFNHDGHMDLAFSVHLTGVFAFLGDGKGGFTESSEGLPIDFPTRKLVATDVDGDGYPDLVAISEGPSLRGQGNPSYGKLLVFFNRNKGRKWQAANVSDPSLDFGGDSLSVGDLNGDKVPDFIGSSVYFGNQDVMYLSQMGKPKWKNFQSDGLTLPSLSYYGGSAIGRFTSSKVDDAIIAYVHFWPSDLDPETVPKPPVEQVINVDYIALRGNQLKRTPIVRWEGNRAVLGIGAADMDGDGKLDFLYTRFDPREAVIMLGDGKGGFKRARVEGLTPEPLSNYDIRIADVNGDGRPDVIIMYESSEPTALAARNGSIQVFLNRGTGVSPASSK
ncbi:MAG: FG-GAP repeat domain-containing protein [Thermoanaerobaculia bacterium]